MPRALLIMLIVGVVMAVVGGATLLYSSYQYNKEMEELMRDLGKRP